MTATSNPTVGVTPPPPTARVAWLDALRGFALYGILLANLPLLAGHPFLAPDARAALPFAAFDAAWNALTGVLIEGKFYALFSFLFGVGIALQLQQVRAAGADPRVQDHEPGDPVWMLDGEPHPDRPAPVLDDDRRVAQVELHGESFDRGAVEVVRVVLDAGRLVGPAEAEVVGRDGLEVAGQVCARYFRYQCDVRRGRPRTGASPAALASEPIRLRGGNGSGPSRSARDAQAPC